MENDKYNFPHGKGEEKMDERMEFTCRHCGALVHDEYDLCPTCVACEIENVYDRRDDR